MFGSFIQAMGEPSFFGMTACLCFMFLDILSGFAGAVMTHEVKSSKMRTGLFHKSALVMVLVCAWLIEFFMLHLPELGFSVPLFTPACCIIVCMEVTSILENAVKINPELSNTKLLSIFTQERADATRN